MSNFNMWKRAFMSPMASFDNPRVAPFTCEYFLEDNNGKVEFKRHDVAHYRTIMELIEGMEPFSCLTITAANKNFYLQCYRGRNAYKLVEIGKKLDENETLVSQYHHDYGITDDLFALEEVCEIFMTYLLTWNITMDNYSVSRKIFGRLV